VLFPRLHSGGEYVIEDWSADHTVATTIAAGLADPASPHHKWAAQLMAGKQPEFRPGQRPLASVAAELLGAPAHRPGHLPRPLSRLALDLVCAKAEQVAAIDSVTVDDEWIVVRRGEADLDADTFALETMCVDRFGLLASGSPPT
jgi:hypothetical protein